MQHLWVWLCEKNVNIQLFRTRLVRAISGQGRETDCTGGLSHFICYLCVAFQAKSVHVEIGVLPVRSVKTGLHHPFHCAMDKWQLWSSWCKCDFILTFAFFFFLQNQNCELYLFSCLQVAMSGGAIWINSFLGILTIIGLWPVSIIFIHLKESLRVLKIVPKYAMYQVCLGFCDFFCPYHILNGYHWWFSDYICPQMVLILSQLQTAIINMLAMNGTIACTPPYTSQARGYCEYL